MNKDLIVRKPSAMIQTNVKGLTLIQRKTINSLIYIAQKKGDRKTYTIPLRELKEMCGITSVGNEDLKEHLYSLTDVKIEFNYLGKDSDPWEVNVLLAGAKIIPNSGEVEYAFSPLLQDRLLQPSIYAPLNVILISGFDSSYTIVLYEFLRDYLNSPKIPLIKISDFRVLMGVEDGKYKLFKDFRINVIDRAVNEINDNTDLFCSYDLFKKGGNRYSDIQFRVKKQDKRLYVADLRAVPPAVQDALPTERRVDAILDILREYCSVPIDEDFLISNIKYSVKHAKSNFSHYLKKALHEDYARQEREEYQKRRELTHQKEMEKLKLLRSKESKEQLGETLFNSLSLEDHLKYTEDVRVELKSLEISSQFITEELIKMKIIEKLLSEKRAERQGVQADLF